MKMTKATLITLAAQVLPTFLPPTFAAPSLRSVDVIAQGGQALPVQTGHRFEEICVVPSKFNGIDSQYSADDLKAESKLCSKSFYEGGQNLKAYGVCPKLNSTNPGTLVVEIPEGWTKENTESAFCKNKSSIASAYKDHYEVDSKFKQSITCSYSPSALAAYHLSRMLGGIINTPVAVVRTMDTATHGQVINKALKLLEGRNSEIIYKSWNMFRSRNQTQDDFKLYAKGSDGVALYGALSQNIKREYVYTEVSGVGPYDTRYQRFQQQAPFKRVADTRPLSQIAGSTRFASIMPVLQQMKDVSNMIVLDSLLSQDDRIGNIHFQMVAMSLDSNGNVIQQPLTGKELKVLEARNPGKTLSRWSESAFTSAATDKVITRVMVLKDNDCGVDVDKRSNNMRVISAIEQVRHMSPTTYNQLLRLKTLANDPNSGLESFFKSTLLYRDQDFSPKTKKSFMDNLNRVVSVIKKNCESGELKLDLQTDFTANGEWQAPSSATQNCSGL
jgi:hypothetical protein